MARLSIGLVVGSARKGSINQKLAEALGKMAGPDFEIRQIRIHDLPLYDPDIDTETPPESVARFRAEVKDTDSFLFVTPEYNRTITPLLANALHWGSRPYGRNSWSGKPGALTGASIGPVGTGGAQVALRDLLTVLDLRLIAQPEAYVHVKDGTFAEDGSIAEEGLRKLLQTKMDKFTAWVKLVSGK